MMLHVDNFKSTKIKIHRSAKLKYCLFVFNAKSETSSAVQCPYLYACFRVRTEVHYNAIITG